MKKDSLAELLALIDEIQNTQTAPVPQTKNKLHYTVDRFIKQFNVRAGLIRVPNYLIYFNYYTKVKCAACERLNSSSFFKYMGQLYPRARVGSQRYYLLDEGSFLLDRESKKEAKMFYKTNQALSRGKRKSKGRKREQSQKENSEKSGEASGASENAQS